MNWIYLMIAILAEVGGTTALKASAGFTRPLPLLITAVGYGIAFFFLGLTLRTIPMGVAYAVWSGIGIVLISLVGWLVHGQSLDMAALIGLGLIVVGVVVIHGFSNTIGH